MLGTSEVIGDRSRVQEVARAYIIDIIHQIIVPHLVGSYIGHTKAAFCDPLHIQQRRDVGDLLRVRLWLARIMLTKQRSRAILGPILDSAYLKV